MPVTTMLAPLFRHPLGRRLWRNAVRLRFHLFQRRRHNRLVLERVAGRDILVLPGVMNPVLFRTGAFLAETVDNGLIPPGARVLEMGSGTGVAAVVAAQSARHVFAVDVNPEAVRCTRLNALLNRVEDRITVCAGDLFAPVAGEHFDVILFNPPFFRGTPESGFDTAWRATDTVERFAGQLDDYLAPGGVVLVILSNHGDHDSFLQAFAMNHFEQEVIARRDLVNEILIVYRLTRTMHDEPEDDSLPVDASHIRVPDHDHTV